MVTHLRIIPVNLGIIKGSIAHIIHSPAVMVSHTVQEDDHWYCPRCLPLFCSLMLYLSSVVTPKHVQYIVVDGGGTPLGDPLCVV